MGKKKRGNTVKRNYSNTPFSILIKPAGPDCNLQCSYCFYLSKQQLFSPETHRMSDKTLEILVSSYLKTNQQVYSFNWQGGEPTLMGLVFFKRVVEFQKRYATPGSTITNTLQTNATQIDAEWARFLAEHKVLTGVSLDGPQDIHDAYRKDADGKGSFEKVMEGIEHLRSCGAEFNILTLVTSLSTGEASRIFNFFVQEGFKFQQYIPCVEFGNKGNPLPYSVSPVKWGDFLVELFNRWYPQHVNTTSIRNFDNVVNFLATGDYYSCTMRGACNEYLVVEHDGSVYPCDFFVEPQYRLGDIMEHGWRQLLNSPLRRRFASLKNHWNELCSSCAYLDYCSGDCIKMRFRKEDNRDSQLLSYLCEGQKLFFEKTLPIFKELARDARINMLHVDGNVPLPPVSRKADDLCFCGSGKKHKNCHPCYIST